MTELTLAVKEMDATTQPTVLYAHSPPLSITCTFLSRLKQGIGRDLKLRGSWVRTALVRAFSPANLLPLHQRTEGRPPFSPQGREGRDVCFSIHTPRGQVTEGELDRQCRTRKVSLGRASAHACSHARRSCALQLRVLQRSPARRSWAAPTRLLVGCGPRPYESL